MWGPYYGIFLIEARKQKEKAIEKKIVSSVDRPVMK